MLYNLAENGKAAAIASPFWWERTRFLRFGARQALEIAGEGARALRQIHHPPTPRFPLICNSKA